ncbi:MAG: phospho-N-acetylmuramoyl-pentapeptide-transferase [Caldisericia bacterium]|nr:phospho-N-acetylmuramoyl-pentapeptide-transferase [Caldisericia bacterium]
MNDIFLLIGAGFAVSLVIGYPIILLLKSFKTGSKVRTEAPEGHQKKAGTPSMGGFIFMISATATALLLSRFTGLMTDFSMHYIKWGLYALWGFGLIGFIDDAIKVFSNSPQGLPGRWTIGLQMMVAMPFIMIHYQILPPVFGAGTPESISAMVYVVAMIATVNAVNLADGLDGLAGGATSITLISLIPIVMLVDKGIALVPLAVIGGILGFLIFNFHPAKVWMGNMGSNALGGILAITAIYSGQIWLFVIGGFLFVFEALSTIIQTTYFKYTKKISKNHVGKRIFLMTPIHHHFELLGWSEKKIVIWFWVASVVFGGLMLGLYYLLV